MKAIKVFDNREVKRIMRKLGKVRIGLPTKVLFDYKEGTVICYPKDKKWVIKVTGKKPITKIRNGRNDVTKHRAKMLLKAVISGLLKS